MKRKVVPCEVYSRVVGYFRPVSQWNKGKQQEFKERKWVKVGNSAFMENNKVAVGGER
jgi:hypothetical protein